MPNRKIEELEQIDTIETGDMPDGYRGNLSNGRRVVPGKSTIYVSE